MWPLYDSVKTFNEFHQRRFKRYRMLKITCETDTGILQNRNDLNGSRRLQAGDVKSPLLYQLS
jgi:hypothetical protein